jgi:hypothetical protein
MPMTMPMCRARPVVHSGRSRFRLAVAVRARPVGKDSAVSAPPLPAGSPLRGWERVGLALAAVLVVGFGVLVEVRSAFQKTSKTDFGVYARAAWAVRDGRDLYAVVDNNGWHYCYPPAFAVLLYPLADPFPGFPRDSYLPFAASVAIWYTLGVACTLWAAHVLAKAVLPGDIRGSRRWWYARLVPVYVCLGGVGFTLGRGQVNVLVVALVAGMFAAAVAGRRFTSGVWLAGAITLKVIPAFLVLFPLARRDARSLAGLAAGLVVLLGVVPAAVWGVQGAIDANRKVVELVLRPGATGGGDQTRAKELTGGKSTDSQSFQAAIHAWVYPDRNARPDDPSRETRLAHWAIGGMLTLLTLLAARRLGDSLADRLVFLGCLCVLMVLLSPVSHMHYYAMVFPLAAGLWLRSLARRPGAICADAWTTATLVAWGVMTAIPLFPGPVFDRLREAGFATAASVGLWAFGAWVMHRAGRAGGVIPPSENRAHPPAPGPVRTAA